MLELVVDLGNYSYDLPAPFKDESETFIFAAGDIGIEYNFDIPLSTLSRCKTRA